MTMARTSLLLIGLALLGSGPFLTAAPARAAGLPVSCEVDRDEGVGQLRIRNVGDLTIPATSIISWRASTGAGGSFQLYTDLGPGQRTFEFNGDTMFLKMGQDTCTAAVASHPPLPIGSSSLGNSLLTGPRIKALDPSAVLKCEHCDKSLPSQGQAVIVPQPQLSAGQGGAVMTLVTGDVDVYDVPDGVGTVIGMLRAGTQVPVILCRADTWCQIQQPQGAAWVWGEFLDR